VSLEQYYTEEAIGERLVAMLPCNAPENCLELSAGKGALLIPIIRKWPEIKISTCELDPKNISYLEENFIGAHHQVDVISYAFDRFYEDKWSYFDLAVCNPPFSWRSNTEYEKDSLKSFGVEWMCSWSKVRSEIIFIIKNLELLKENGYLAIILPELIVFSDSFSRFREHLSAICSIVSISEVEAGAFKGTEARTYILVLSKRRFNKPFSLTDKKNCVSMHSQNDFHRWSDLVKKSQLFALAELMFELKRGRHSGKSLRESHLSYYHTTGFFNREDLSIFSSDIGEHLVQGSKPLVASAGQVLINRVGTRALGKAIVVPHGRYAVSDCAYRLTVPTGINPHDVVVFWQKLAEEIIQNARGTCAQYITKTDILNYLALFLESQREINSTQATFEIA